MPVTPAAVSRFHDDGFLVVDDLLDAAQLAALRAECERRLEAMVAMMDSVGAERLGLTHRDSRYFLHAPYRDSGFLPEFLLGGPLADLAAALIGPDVFLFLELFVVKCAEVGAAMAWHQDGGYVLDVPHEPYVSLWVALDDMTAANGTLAVLPRQRAPQTGPVAHRKDRGSNDFVGYEGNDPGEVVEVSAGSVVAMTSTTLHRSLPNSGAAARRAFLVSYSPAPIVGANGELWNLADRCHPAPC
jgi:ectoine hydroxylase-related dioxygenase (phytanoyl-CoA dioxygenase family)